MIAELKLSHTIGGISKLRSGQVTNKTININKSFHFITDHLQQKAAEEVEKEQYRKFLGQFTTENFLKKVGFKKIAFLMNYV